MNDIRLPQLSLIVVAYNMRREILRTLRSLQSSYQRGVHEDDYEVIVVENGSSERLDGEAIECYGRNFRYFYLENPSPSPAYAVNFGVKQSRGELVSIMIDGARVASPGIIYYTLRACCHHEQPVILVPSWHLGSHPQQNARVTGYNQNVEDKLLEQIRWPDNGYDLFTISVFAPSASRGLFMNPGESNFLTMKRVLFGELGGYDERFDLPGGGLVNQDTLSRALDRSDAHLIILLGEGTFHQIHGGVASNAAPEQSPWALFDEQYKRLRGKAFERHERRADYYGHIPRQLWRHLRYSSDYCFQMENP